MTHEKLAGMNIHAQIKAAREKKGWSMLQLAQAVSAAEELKKELSWQTVQQWENGTSAPKRLRLKTVSQVLGVALDGTGPLAAETPRVEQLPPPYAERPAKGISTLSLLNELAQRLANVDPAAREAIGSLLKSMCSTAGDPTVAAGHIATLMGAPGNGRAQQSINSP